MVEVLVIGGGPVGSLAAYRAARKGCEVLLLEQRETIGVPDHCAGLLSVNGLAKLGHSSLPSSVIQNGRVRGAIFHSPSGNRFQVAGKEAQAVVVNRTLFDQYLAGEAEKQGAQILKGRKVTHLHFDREKRIIKARFTEHNSQKKKVNKSLESFLAVLAEGRKARLTRTLGFGSVKKNHSLSAMQFLVENIQELNEEFVELFVGNKVAPGFFAWIIPISDSCAKVGLASNTQAAAHLSYFLKKHPPSKARFRDMKILSQHGGEVLISRPLKKTSANGFMVAGDASGQTKATTGGGVITGGLAGLVAGEVAAHALKLQDNSQKLLGLYDQIWRQKMGFQLKTMALFRQLVNRLPDRSLDLAFKTIIKNNLEGVIEQKADIDSQAAVIFSLLTNPIIIKLGFRLLPQLIAGV